MTNAGLWFIKIQKKNGPLSTEVNTDMAVKNIRGTIIHNNLAGFIVLTMFRTITKRWFKQYQNVQAHSAKAELLSARCFATPASKRNVPECRAKPNCFVSLNY
jgi:hypothetical protein